MLVEKYFHVPLTIILLDDGADLNRRCTRGTADIEKQKFMEEECSESDEEPPEMDEGNEAVQRTQGDVLTFKPPYLLSECEEFGTMTKRISLAILLR